MNCPKCSSNIYCKSGFSQGRQRYKCKDCHYHYTVEHRYGTGTSAIRQQALELYLEGLGFRSIGRILGFSNVSILNWIREFGKKLDALKSEKSVSVAEIDEMHSYVGNKKNYCWIWIAVDRNRYKFINCVIGKRNTKTGKRLWKELKNKDIGDVMTDCYQPYKAFVPSEKHTQSKAETFTVEGYNSLFRHYLARMRRKSKCYSKYETMLEYSFKLLMAKWNGELSMLN